MRRRETDLDDAYGADDADCGCDGEVGCEEEPDELEGVDAPGAGGALPL